MPTVTDEKNGAYVLCKYSIQKQGANITDTQELGDCTGITVPIANV